MTTLLAAVRWLLLLAAFAAPAAAARDFKVDPGEMPELRPDEGLLVVAIDSDMDVRSLIIRGEASNFDSVKLDKIGEGSTMGLYVLPAGTYRWDRLNVGWLGWILRNDPEGRFEVKAGRINYAGDLVYRDLVSMHIANRGLRVLDWLDREHPRLVQSHEFSYSGSYPDPFPAFYREQLAEAAKKPADDHLPLPKPGTLPMPVRELWREPRIGSLALSPTGALAVTAVKDDEREWRIDLYDLQKETISTLATSAGSIDALEWVADDILAAVVDTLSGERQMFFRFAPDGTHVVHTMDRPGYVVDSLPGDPDDVVFMSEGSRGELLLHRIDVRHAEGLAGYRYPLKERLNVGLENDRAWYTDATGAVRAAIVRAEDERRLVWGGQGRFVPVLTLDDPEFFAPLAMSADGLTIYGLSEKDRGQKDLVVFDPVQRKITRTVFTRPGIDVVGMLVDEKRVPTGVSYYEGGRLVMDYFDQSANDFLGTLSRSFPDRTVAVLDRDRDGKRMLLGVDGIDQPLQIYHYDAAAKRASLLDETAPWLAERKLAPGHLLKVTAPDGLVLDAFLTLPAGEGKRPLIVFPHGGPIGIADRRHFDPEVQFLASLGYAVLQVNFRGSADYGVRFREAGYRNYGTLIEDDIDAAIAAALAQHPLDPDRMCVVGASYGGYSGLSLAVRSPERFRCVVSMSGVSDRVLFFTASDAGRRKEGREMLEKLIGDPNGDMASMLRTSPLFQYRALTTPVMLVHGGEDIRVDYEHTRRLVRMLTLAGRPPVLLEFPEEAHGIDDLDNIETAWNGIAGFLREHLDGPRKIAATPAAAPPAGAAPAAAAPAANAD